MVLNFKEECRCTSFTIKRLLEPFNPIMNFTLIFLYLMMEVTFVGIDFENKVCYLGHLVGFLSGFVVGFIVLDNKVEEPWETFTGRFLLSSYIIGVLCMMVLHMGEFSVLESRCLHCWKAAHQIWNSNLT